MKWTMKKSDLDASLPLVTGNSFSDHLFVIRRLLRDWFGEDRDIFRFLPFLDLLDFGEKKLTLRLLCLEHPQAGKFFYDMVLRHLLVAKHFILSKVFFAPFCLSSCPSTLLIGEIGIVFYSAFDPLEVKKRFTMLKEDILFGLRSPYHANRMLEIKAITLEDKRGLVQDRIAKKIRRFPLWYDDDLFSSMQHFFLAMHSDYFRTHEVGQIGQLISLFYLLEKRVCLAIEEIPSKRHLFLKVLWRRYYSPLGVKRVIGIGVGMNFLCEREVFEMQHLYQAILSIHPSLQQVEKSTFLYRSSALPMQFLYLECEPKKGEVVTYDLLSLLRFTLKARIKARIAHLYPSLFMPRNEEEVMRHVVTLGREIRFLRDPAQVIIAFDHQTDQEIVFTIILSRIIHPKAPSTKELLSLLGSLSPRLERIKSFGLLRKKYPKEALVIKLSVKASSFLREDQSIDLYRARRAVMRLLTKALGSVRDYNGGMIAKQSERFTALLRLVGQKGGEHRLLLENFFHAITPVEKQAYLEPKALANWFFLLVDAVNSREKEKKVYHREKDTTFAVVREYVTAIDGENRAFLVDHLKENFPTLSSFEISLDERHFIGFLSTEVNKQQQIIDLLV